LGKSGKEKKKDMKIEGRDNEVERKRPQECLYLLRQIFGYTYDNRFG